MPSDSYLVLIEDDDLAHAVAGELEYQLGRDGHGVTALIPATRGPRFIYRPADQASPRPIAVALYQAGLLEALEPLGLSAYIGIPADERPATITWDHGTTAFLLPVTTARDLTDAIAADTARQRSHTAPPRRRAARQPAPPALTRRLTIASVAGLAGITGSLLAMTLPAAAATTQPHPPASHPITATLTDYSTSSGTTASPAPAPSPTPSPIASPIASPTPTPSPSPPMAPPDYGGLPPPHITVEVYGPTPSPTPTPSPSPNPYGGGL